MKDVILKVQNISYAVENKKNRDAYSNTDIIKNISFELERGEILGLTGQSGSGKTTLAKILAGVYKPSSGKIETYFSKDWSKNLPKPIQILFQNDGELINPYRKVNDILTEAFELKLGRKNNFSDKVISLIDKFQLPQTIKDHKGSQLSGGEQQRIALARIYIIEPEILILDEPFSSQDVEAQLNIVNIIKKIKEELNLTVICVSHDLNIIKKISDDILIMFNGKIVESGKTKHILDNPSDNYTKFLLEAQSLKLTREEIENFHSNYEQNKRDKNS